METNPAPEEFQPLAIPGRVEIVTGNGGLPLVKIKTPWSTAEIYLHGAHITHFQKNDELPLIFTSAKSFFAPGKAIRGGIPICFPWFGSRAGAPSHGFARTTDWRLARTSATADGVVTLQFSLPEISGYSDWSALRPNFIVTVSDKLAMELCVENASAQALAFEGCLHTYFCVGDVSQVSISGLKGVHYLDKVENFARKLETGAAIKIRSEVDRVYLSTTNTVDIHDPKWHRKISVEKSGSNSTVVWNPWADSAKAMADFGDDEYREMVCVESGNVGEDRITLAPGKISLLKVNLSSESLK